MHQNTPTTHQDIAQAWTNYAHRQIDQTSFSQTTSIDIIREIASISAKDAIKDFTLLEHTSSSEIQETINKNILDLLNSLQQGKPLKLTPKNFQNYPKEEAQLSRNQNLITTRDQVLKLTQGETDLSELEAIFNFITTILETKMPAEAINSDFMNHLEIQEFTHKHNLNAESLNDLIDNFILWKAQKSQPHEAIIFHQTVFGQLNIQELEDLINKLGFKYTQNEITNIYEKFSQNFKNTIHSEFHEFINNETFAPTNTLQSIIANKPTPLTEQLYGLDVARIQRGDINTRNQLGIKIQPFCAQFLHKKTIFGLSKTQEASFKEEFSQQSLLTILKKICGFNPRKGNLTTFLMSWLKAAFIKFKHKQQFINVPMSTLPIINYVKQNPDCTLQELKNLFPTKRINTLQECLSGKFNIQISPIEHSFNDEDDAKTINIVDILNAANSAPNPEEAIDKSTISSEIHTALAALSPITRTIIEGRILGEEKLHEIGDQYGVTRERIRQLEKAFRKIAASLEADPNFALDPKYFKFKNDRMRAEGEFYLFIRRFLKFREIF